MPSLTKLIKHSLTKESLSVANIKSQKKRILTNEKARLRNNAVKAELRTAIRSVNSAVKSADKEAAGTALVAASRKLDKAVSKGVIHKNNAANRKSAIARKVGSL
jgi:small subunit ribosomal protein S20